MTVLRYTLTVILYVGLIFNTTGCSNNVEYTPPKGSTDIAITYYAFGKMVIDGKEYNQDLAIFPGGKIGGWSFNYASHLITPNDFKALITDRVKTVIIGTGYSGAASLSAEGKKAIEEIRAKGIQIHVLSTGKAVKLFNASSKKGLLCCFHLNC